MYITIDIQFRCKPEPCYLSMMFLLFGKSIHMHIIKEWKNWGA
jgi:hypothetical protein